MTMFFLMMLLFLLVISYAVFLIWLTSTLKSKNSRQALNSRRPFISVIVAARNEDKNIRECLSHLLNQNYPAEKYEVIVIDDRSEDTTVEIIKSVNNRRLKFIQITDVISTIAPKKRAIDSGIRSASGEIIVTTDADCFPGQDWLTTLVGYFDEAVGLVAGYNPYKIKAGNLFQEMMALDYFAMAAVAAAFANIGYPISCTGGNLAYRNSVFDEISGFTKFSTQVSGDDDLFLEQVREKTNWKIIYANNPESFVYTLPPANLREFIQQRIRYASKGRLYKRNVTVVLLFVYLLNLMFCAGFFISIFSPQSFIYSATAFTVKSASEFIFLKRSSVLFHYRLSIFKFILTALIHPLYISLIGFAGQVIGFEWKGKKYGSRAA